MCCFCDTAKTFFFMVSVPIFSLFHLAWLCFWPTYLEENPLSHFFWQVVQVPQAANATAQTELLSPSFPCFVSFNRYIRGGVWHALQNGHVSRRNIWKDERKGNCFYFTFFSDTFSLSYSGLKDIDLSVLLPSLCTCYAVCCFAPCAPLDFMTVTVLSREWPSKHDGA